MPPSDVSFVKRAPHFPATEKAQATLVIASSIALLLLLVAWPILHVKLPPLGDYVNHLGRMHVIAEAGRDPALAQFYTIKWKVIPNLAMDVLVPPLAKVMSVYWAGKIFVLASFALILSGVQVIHRSLFQRLSLGGLIAVLFLYSETTSLGLFNYLFGIGVALWGTAFWISLRRINAALRAGVSLAFVIVLFFCHFEALGLYGVTLAAIEAWHFFVDRPGRRRLLVDLAAFALPFLVVPFLLAAGPTGDATLAIPNWRLTWKADGLWYIAKTYYKGYDLFTGAAIAIFTLWAWRRRWMRLHPMGWFVLVVSAATFIALPFGAMSASHVDDRFALGPVFILCGFLAWDLGQRARQYRFLAALAVLVLLRVGGVEAAANQLQTIVTAFDRSLALIPRGSKIMVAQADGGFIPMYDTLEALPCLAMIERSSLVSIAFSHPAEQVLVVNPPYRAITGGLDDDPPDIKELLHPPQWSRYTQSSRIYWRHWPRDYDYLYVLSAGEAANPAPDLLALLDRGPHFQLYRIRHAVPGQR